MLGTSIYACLFCIPPDHLLFRHVPFPFPAPVFLPSLHFLSRVHLFPRQTALCVELAPILRGVLSSELFTARISLGILPCSP